MLQLVFIIFKIWCMEQRINIIQTFENYEKIWLIVGSFIANFSHHNS